MSSVHTANSVGRILHETDLIRHGNLLRSFSTEILYIFKSKIGVLKILSWLDWLIDSLIFIPLVTQGHCSQPVKSMVPSK